MLVMFFSFFILRHAFSEVPRPIAVKLGHMVGNCLNFMIQVQKFGGPPPKKSGGQKHAKFRSILYNLRL